MQDRIGRGHGFSPAVSFVVVILLFAVVGFAVFERDEQSGLERRTEASLPGAPTVGPGETELRDRVRIVATLTLVQGERRSASVTEVEIGGERRLLGPAGRDVDGRPDGADVWIRDTVARTKATQHLTVGELRVAQGVPREDVRRVADGFLAAGISDVTFAGPPRVAGVK